VGDVSEDQNTRAQNCDRGELAAVESASVTSPSVPALLCESECPCEAARTDRRVHDNIPVFIIPPPTERLVHLLLCARQVEALPEPTTLSSLIRTVEGLCRISSASETLCYIP
jgi:hypothetical protein